MSWSDFLMVFVGCAATILACRIVPLFVLKGKNLPLSIERALRFIPPAAFAALVANDLFSPGMFSDGIWPACIPLIAALIVGIFAWKTRSLLWCALAGVAVYSLLSFI